MLPKGNRGESRTFRNEEGPKQAGESARSSSKTSVWQINLHRARVPSYNLSKEVEKEAQLIALIQEPWTVGTRICGRLPSGRLHVGDTGGERPRTCIYTRGVDAWRLSRYCSRDLTSIQINIGGDSSPLIIASVYMASERTTPPTELRELVEHCHSRRIPLIVGGDVNSHHTAWGSSDVNERGQRLMEFIEEWGLDWLNTGNSPTFETSVRREVLDLTLINGKATGLAKRWRVDPRPSFSDHRYIRFDIAGAVLEARKYRPVRKTNWETFTNLIGEKLSRAEPRGPLHEEKDIEREATFLEETLTSTFDEMCPERHIKSKTEVVWWKQDLEKLRKLKLGYL